MKTYKINLSSEEIVDLVALVNEALERYDFSKEVASQYEALIPALNKKAMTEAERSLMVEVLEHNIDEYGSDYAYDLHDYFIKL